MSKIDTLIFDFGDVFINLDKLGATNNALKLFGVKTFCEAMLKTNELYETGSISTEAFLNFYQANFKHLTTGTIIDAWNYIILDFPKYRFKFLKTLKTSGAFKLILLSNTNALHIQHIKNTVPFYEDFKNCFDAFYLSHEIHLRKPDREVFEFVMGEQNLSPEQCLFIDDTKENTDSAEQMGFKVWNLDETKEDVINMFTTNKALF